MLTQFDFTGMHGVDTLTQPPRHVVLPPADTVRDHDPHLADLIEQHAQTVAKYRQAVRAVIDATGPNGTTWRHAIATDGATIAAGQHIEPGTSATRALLDGHNDRVVNAVLIGRTADALLDTIEQRATDVLLPRLTAAQTSWAVQAADQLRDAVNRKSRGAVETLRESYLADWPTLCALRAWAHDPRSNYNRPARYRWPTPCLEILADADVRKILNELVGERDPDLGSMYLVAIIPVDIRLAFDREAQAEAAKQQHESDVWSERLGYRVDARPDEGRAGKLRNRITHGRK